MTVRPSSVYGFNILPSLFPKMCLPYTLLDSWLVFPFCGISCFHYCFPCETVNGLPAEQNSIRLADIKAAKEKNAKMHF